jgi:hypothetical protein
MEDCHIEEYRFCDGPLAEPDEDDEPPPDEPSNAVPLTQEEIAEEDCPF